MQATEEETKSEDFDFSTEFTLQILDNLGQAAHYPNMTEELAEVLLIPSVSLTYQVETDLDVEPNQRARADK